MPTDQCAGCRRYLRPDQQKCPYCGVDNASGEGAAPNGALIKCPDCGKEISRSALACPNCGRPMKAQPQVQREGPFLQTLNAGCVVVVVIVLIVVAVVIIA